MKMHQRRTWQITDVETPEELASMLTGIDWTLCSGFRFCDFLWLNDSTSEDGASEWAAVREADHVQVESITFGWVDSTRGLAIIRESVADDSDNFSASYGQIAPRQIETPEQHGRCGRCA